MKLRNHLNIDRLYHSGRMMHTSLLFVFLANSQVNSQQVRPKTILEEPESFQRQFVKDYLREAALSDHLDGYTYDSASIAFFTLAETKDWVLPMAEARIKEWELDPLANPLSAERVLSPIAHTGSIAALEFMAKVTVNRPDPQRWVRAAMYGSAGGQGYYTKLYYALESTNPLIKEAANEVIPNMVNQHLTDFMYVMWAADMIDRYKHEPTADEIRKDPLVKFAQLQVPGSLEVMSEKLLQSRQMATTLRAKIIEEKKAKVKP